MSGGYLKPRDFLKPIIHCNMNLFALGPHVGLDPQRENHVGFAGLFKCVGTPNTFKKPREPNVSHNHRET